MKQRFGHRRSTVDAKVRSHSGSLTDTAMVPFVLTRLLVVSGMELERGVSMPLDQPTDNRRLAYVRAADLDRFQCRPFPTIDILDLRDRPAGRLGGIVIDRHENRPVYLVVAKRRRAGEKGQNWFLVPVGDAWFDDSERAVRIEVSGRERVPFDPDEFERMTPEQADEYERHVLATCCPEVGFHRDGRPNYARLQQFNCPVWLRPNGD